MKLAATLFLCLAATVSAQERLTLTFALTPAQRADLDRLLANQHDPSHPEYRRWLTPAEFADRFGMDRVRLDEVADALRAEGFTVEPARSRRWIAITAPIDQTAAIAADRRRIVRRLPSHLSALIETVRAHGDIRWNAPRFTPQYALSDGAHALAPADLAAIYGTAGDGEGQSIAIVGQSNFYLSDVQAFREKFRLPDRVPRLVLVGDEPGFDPNGGMLEALVDLQWAGAVAPRADLIYVYARDVLDALHAAIDRNLAPVVNFSFGVCEANLPPALVDSLRLLAKQANAQGITWVASSGDSGAAACNLFGNHATLGLNVMFPASLPEVTGVGGTQLDEGSGSYWVDGAATRYIPEIAWNDTTRSPGFSATGGGASLLFPRPDWQRGHGVPLKDARHVPDVAFPASPFHNPYMAIAGNTLITLGGTSISGPVFSGVMAVVNQRAGRVGNINPLLYRAHDAGASWFHDVTGGDNIVQCVPGTKDCVDGVVGYRAGPGYDPVTGLGSIDIPAFVEGVRAYLLRPAFRLPSRAGKH